MPDVEYKIPLDEFRSKFGDPSGYVEYVSPQSRRRFTMQAAS